MALTVSFRSERLQDLIRLMDLCSVFSRTCRVAARASSVRRRAQILAVAAATLGCSGGPRVRTGQVVHLVAAGQYEAAERKLREQIRQQPGDVAPRRLLIRVLALLGQLGRAEHEAALLAGRLGQKSPIPWIELGHANELVHRFDVALALYDKASRLAPYDPRAPLTGGLRSARWGEAELAEPRLEEALRRDPRNSRAWHALGLVRFKLGKVSAAREAFAQGLVAEPQLLENRLGLASLAVYEHRPGQALAEYNAILALRPQFGDAYLGRSWALLELGRYDAALRALEQARALGANADVIERQRALLDARRKGATQSAGQGD